MNYKITDMLSIKLIGFVKVFDMKTSYKDIPLFWDEIYENFFIHVYKKGLPTENEYEQEIVDNGIGKFGVFLECHGSKFKYMIGSQENTMVERFQME